MKNNLPIGVDDFKDIKGVNWTKNFELIKITFACLFNQFDYLLEGDVLKGYERTIFNKIYNGEANQSGCERSIAILSKALNTYYQEKVMIILDEYREYSGFTEDEVKKMLCDFKIEEDLKKIIKWYNGYRFGESMYTTIYNPWSIIMYMHHGILKPYWINTSGNAIIRKMVMESGKNIQYQIEDIIHNQVVPSKKINENIIYSEIMDSENNIWSFMLLSGYLKSVHTRIEEGQLVCDLKDPNEEIRFYFRNMIRNWLSEALKQSSPEVMLKALLKGDLETFQYMFQDIFARTVSYNDVGRDTSENFYHAFVLVMLVFLDKDHDIRSNRESGFRRYDVMIRHAKINN